MAEPLFHSSQNAEDGPTSREDFDARGRKDASSFESKALQPSSETLKTDVPTEICHEPIPKSPHMGTISLASPYPDVPDTSKVASSTPRRKRPNGTATANPPLAHPQRRSSGRPLLQAGHAKKLHGRSFLSSPPGRTMDAWIDITDDTDGDSSSDTHHTQRTLPQIVHPEPVRKRPLQPLSDHDIANARRKSVVQSDSGRSISPRSQKTPRLDAGHFTPTHPPASAPPKVPPVSHTYNASSASLGSGLKLQQILAGTPTGSSLKDSIPNGSSLQPSRGSSANPGSSANGLTHKSSQTALRSKAIAPAASSGKSPSQGRRASYGGPFDTTRPLPDFEALRNQQKGTQIQSPDQATQPAKAPSDDLKAVPAAPSAKGVAHPQLVPRTPTMAAASSTTGGDHKARARPQQPHDPHPSASTGNAPRRPSVDATPLAPFSLWEYLKEEVLATDFDSTQEMKWERVTNFVAVPWWVEKIILFGFVICLDSFLYTFTILPLRFCVAIYLWISSNIKALFSPKGTRQRLHSSHKCDILKSGLVICSCVILSKVTDASKMYHSVRGQDVIKLYVIFNVMEILDRLCCSLGQDLLDALFSRMTLGRRKDGTQPIARPVAFFCLALVYIQLHTMVLFYQLVTLNVAINSYDNALLTLLLSNQFVEIKGAVFKKFEKENLFQMTCADIVERFQLALILTAIGVRNLIEVSGGTGGSMGGEVPLPRSFTFLPSISVLETSFAPVAIVLLSECLVDWLKHAFITKFNHIRPNVYGRFMDVLCRDLVVGGPTPAPPSNAAPAPTSQGTAYSTSSHPPSSSGAAAPPSASTSTAPTASSEIASSVQAAAASISATATTSAAMAAAAARSKRRHTFVDQSPIVSRRLGFAALPLACLLIRISAQIWGMIADDSHYDECSASATSSSTIVRGAFSSGSASTGSLSLWNILTSLPRWLIGSSSSQQQILVSTTVDGLIQFLAWSLTLLLGWLFLVAVKLLLGTFLISFATHRYRTMTMREAEEELNARDRNPIGVDKGERDYEARGKQYLESQQEYNVGETAADKTNEKSTASSVPPATATKKPQGTNLMDVSRYTMVKSRLW